jgi:hypothetical protein
VHEANTVVIATKRRIRPNAFFIVSGINHTIVDAKVVHSTVTVYDEN